MQKHQKLLFIIVLSMFVCGCSGVRHTSYVPASPLPSLPAGTVFDVSNSPDTLYIDSNAVDVPASFLYGDKALWQFIANHLHYPENARECNVTGKVVVSFVVEKDGSLSTITVLHDIGGGCAQEVVRVVRLMPRWTPAMKDGRAVRSLFSLPVVFKLR